MNCYATHTENEMKHTQGPWLYHESTNQVHVKNGATVAEVMPHYRNAVADGKLLAAAPELLEAASQALAHIEADEVTHGRKFAAGEMLRAAIAKAVGHNK